MNFTVCDSEIKTFIKVHDKKELADSIYNTIKYYEEYTEALRKENTELRANAYQVVSDELKDKIQSLQEQLDLSYGEFSSQKEKEAYKDFEQRHMHERLTSKIQGGKAPYLIPTGVGIGTHLEVVCPICGEKEDITDIGVW